MSIRAMVSVFDFAPPQWDTTTRLVALVIADHVNDSTSECHPSISRIAHRSGLSPRQVRRILNTLENDGVITRRQRFENNRQTSNSYLWTFRITLPANPVTHDMGESVTGDTPRDVTDDRVGAVTHDIQNHHKNHQLKPN